MAAAKAHAHVGAHAKLARPTYRIRTHHRTMDCGQDRKPAIIHQPPSFNGGKGFSPCFASGASSESQGSRPMNLSGFQSTRRGTY